MSSTTAVDAAQDALLAAIVARPGLASLVALKAVTLGYPPSGLQAEAVWVSGNVETWEISAPDFDDDQERSESFRLSVYVQVTRTADTYVLIRDRLMELIREVGAAVEPNHTLGGVVTTSRIIGGAINEAVLEESKRQAVAVLVVQVSTSVD